MNKHKQKMTKVNVWVDAKISNLVEALNSFPELSTIESCQGSKNSTSWICFRYGKHAWIDLAKFVLEYFGPGIAREVGDRADVIIHVSEQGEGLGELSIRDGAIPFVTRAVIKLRRGYVR